MFCTGLHPQEAVLEHELVVYRRSKVLDLTRENVTVPDFSILMFKLQLYLEQYYCPLNYLSEFDYTHRKKSQPVVGLFLSMQWDNVLRTNLLSPNA